MRTIASRSSKLRGFMDASDASDGTYVAKVLPRILGCNGVGQRRVWLSGGGSQVGYGGLACKPDYLDVMLPHIS